MTRFEASAGVTAVLGPTNTGKTHLAMERMLGHASGMIGFPLRLLARENYDRVVKQKGPDKVALITGEERIVPPHARWFICTVESMPVDKPVSFLAVDEIQLIGDPDRGHIFTDRLLRARGSAETMVMGAETAKPLIRALVPDAQFVSRERMSTLSYIGVRKTTRLPRRCAIVAFSVADVYQIAELTRRQRGGCAVVMGALSPRARNAQVDMYQSGEVDFMVATDAIGMGLNMDLDHVAFARLSKFDGRGPRRLTAAEIGQIAGRAGRGMTDGRFAATDEAGPIDPEIVEAVEAHRFDPVAAAWWRNPDLEFSSVAALLRSLEAAPPHRALKRKRDADDHLALDTLSRQPEILALADRKPRVKLLWDVCQIPDFRKTLADTHLKLVGQVFRHLTGPTGRLPEDWATRQIARLDNPQGDIDQLSARLAHIRTWTYIAHRPDWLPHPERWRETARAVEDRLSDALHERLTARFVDRRGSALLRRMADPGDLLAGVRSCGAVVVEGHPVGRLEGFRFEVDEEAEGEEAKRLIAAARRALRSEIDGRLDRLAQDAERLLTLTEGGEIAWGAAPIGRLIPGRTALTPGVLTYDSDLLPSDRRDRLRLILAAWLKRRIETELAPLPDMAAIPGAGPMRGLLHQLGEALGCLPTDAAAGLIADLNDEDRRTLARQGVRLGRESIYVKSLLRDGAARLALLLAAVFSGVADPPPPPRGASAPMRPDWSPTLLAAAGFRAVGPRAMRADRLEHLALAARRLSRQGPFAATPELAGLAGCKAGEIGAVLGALGYRAAEDGRFQIAPTRRLKRGAGAPPAKPPAPDHPFAQLAALRLGKVDKAAS